MSSHYNLNSGVVEQIMIIIGLLPSLESVGLSIRWVSACSPTILSLFFSIAVLANTDTFLVFRKYERMLPNWKREREKHRQQKQRNELND